MAPVGALRLRLRRRLPLALGLIRFHMSYWIIRIGIVLGSIGALALSPVTDLLPVGLWASLTTMFSPDNSPGYFRVVSTAADPFNQLGIGLVCLGLLLVAIGFAIRHFR